jgi:hypothetical protein
MLSTTIEGYRRPEWKLDDAHQLYLAHDGDTAFYVGDAHRVWAHLGLGGQARNAFGDLVRNNAPASEQWQLDFFTVADCLPYIEAHLDEDTARYCKRLIAEGKPYMLDREPLRALVMHFEPCLNRNYNQNPTPLPSHYRAPDAHTQISDEAMRRQVDRLPPIQGTEDEPAS